MKLFASVALVIIFGVGGVFSVISAAYFCDMKHPLFAWRSLALALFCAVVLLLLINAGVTHV